MDAACCEYPLSWHNSDCLGWHKTNTPHHLLIKSTYGIGVQNKTTTPSLHHLTDHLTDHHHTDHLTDHHHTDHLTTFWPDGVQLGGRCAAAPI